MRIFLKELPQLLYRKNMDSARSNLKAGGVAD